MKNRTLFLTLAVCIFGIHVDAQNSGVFSGITQANQSRLQGDLLIQPPPSESSAELQLTLDGTNPGFGVALTTGTDQNMRLIQQLFDANSSWQWLYTSGTNVFPSMSLEPSGKLTLFTPGTSTPSIVLDTGAGQITVDGQPFGGGWNMSGADAIFNSGNVGIGTLNPGATLDVNGSAAFSGGVLIGGTGGTGAATMLTVTGGASVDYLQNGPVTWMDLRGVESNGNVSGNGTGLMNFEWFQYGNGPEHIIRIAPGQNVNRPSLRVEGGIGIANSNGGSYGISINGNWIVGVDPAIEVGTNPLILAGGGSSEYDGGGSVNSVTIDEAGASLSGGAFRFGPDGEGGYQGTLADDGSASVHNLTVAGAGRFDGPVHIEEQGDLTMGEFQTEPVPEQQQMFQQGNHPINGGPGIILSGTATRSGYPAVSGSAAYGN